MNLIKCLPLEKINNRPDVEAGDKNYLQECAISEILNLFFIFVNCEALASCNLVCRQWYQLTDHKPVNDRLWNQAIAKEIYQLASFVFGKEEWIKYFGDIGNAPNYPRDICKILTRNCPFFEGQTVGKTHMLILVPEKVNSIPITLNSIGELVKKPKEGIKTGYNSEFRCFEENQIFEEHGETTVKKTHWILITNILIPSSTNYNHAYYNRPCVLDAVITFFVRCVSSGKFLLCRGSYTRCQEKTVKRELIVGDFGMSGLNVRNYHYCNEIITVLACRVFAP